MANQIIWIRLQIAFFFNIKNGKINYLSGTLIYTELITKKIFILLIILFLKN